MDVNNDPSEMLNIKKHMGEEKKESIEGNNGGVAGGRPYNASELSQ